jgi:REP element-mobilizing transposase RayT
VSVKQLPVIRAKQLGFQILENQNAKSHGGNRLKSNPKSARPVSIKRSMHLVLRSSLAKGKLTFLQRERSRQVERVIHSQGRRFGVKVYRLSNAGNHLHLIVLPRSRRGFTGFIRAITGLIARLTLGVEKGTSKNLKFWDARPFSRIVEWGRDFEGTCRYLAQNTLEALGFIDYQPRSSGPNPPRSRPSKLILSG